MYFIPPEQPKGPKPFWLPIKSGAEKDAGVFFGIHATPANLVAHHLAEFLHGAALGGELMKNPHQCGAVVGDYELGHPSGPKGFHEVVGVVLPWKILHLKVAALVPGAVEPGMVGNHLAGGEGVLESLFPLIPGIQGSLVGASGFLRPAALPCLLEFGAGLLHGPEVGVELVCHGVFLRFFEVWFSLSVVY